MNVSFFLRHFAGFFIQFGAGMILSLLPFSEGAFRYSSKRVAAGCGILVGLSSAIFPFIMGTKIGASESFQSIFANVYMLLAILIFVFLYFKSLRVENVKKLIVLVLVLVYAATQYLVVNFIISLLHADALREVYAPLTLALYAGTAVVMFPVFALLMRLVLREYLIEIEVENIRREFGIMVLVTLLYYAMLVIYASWPNSLLEHFGWWTVPPLLLATLILGVFYWTLFRESVRRRHDNEERKALEIQKLQYENITHEMEQTRRMRHDMQHSMNRLAQLFEQGDEQALKACFSELSVQISRRDAVIYCKNTIVNGLLQYYVGMAADQDIRCEVHADCGEVTISQLDLTVLLGNMMENAIHACGQIEEENMRWIQVEIGVLGGSMLIQTVNPCKEVHPSGKYRIDGSFLPAAAFMSSREGGGMGLYSLEHTAGKYGGQAHFRFDGQSKCFTSRIRLNLYPDKLRSGKTGV